MELLQQTRNTLLSLICSLIVFASVPTLAGEMYYVHTDHLGTPKMMTDENQSVVWAPDYTPFGEMINGQEDTEAARFPGQYFDVATGLHYNYFRDYDPTLGRYIQSDPIGLGGGINTYAYVSGNPIMRFDPFGLIECTCVGSFKYSYPKGRGQKYCEYTCRVKDGKNTTLTIIAPGGGDQCVGARTRDTVSPTFDITTIADGFDEFDVDTEDFWTTVFGKSEMEEIIEDAYTETKKDSTKE